MAKLKNLEMALPGMKKLSAEGVRVQGAEEAVWT
jgi:hypothetical protein